MRMWFFCSFDAKSLRIYDENKFFWTMETLSNIPGLGFDIFFDTHMFGSVFFRVVKSCQIRHPEVRIRYPDTSEGSHRIASYI